MRTKRTYINVTSTNKLNTGKCGIIPHIVRISPRLLGSIPSKPGSRPRDARRRPGSRPRRGGSCAPQHRTPPATCCAALEKQRGWRAAHTGPQRNAARASSCRRRALGPAPPPPRQKHLAARLVSTEKRTL